MTNTRPNLGNYMTADTQALRANTSVAADLCGIGDRKETIAVGKDADIVAVPGNPLDDLTCIQRVLAVFVAGNQVRRSVTDQSS